MVDGRMCRCGRATVELTLDGRPYWACESCDVNGRCRRCLARMTDGDNLRVADDGIGLQHAVCPDKATSRGAVRHVDHGDVIAICGMPYRVSTLKVVTEYGTRRAVTLHYDSGMCPECGGKGTSDISGECDSCAGTGHAGIGSEIRERRPDLERVAGGE
jgi:hypothetical protein